MAGEEDALTGDLLDVCQGILSWERSMDSISDCNVSDLVVDHRSRVRRQGKRFSSSPSCTSWPSSPLRTSLLRRWVCSVFILFFDSLKRVQRPPKSPGSCGRCSALTSLGIVRAGALDHFHEEVAVFCSSSLEACEQWWVRAAGNEEAPRFGAHRQNCFLVAT